MNSSNFVSFQMYPTFIFNEQLSYETFVKFVQSQNHLMDFDNMFMFLILISSLLCIRTWFSVFIKFHLEINEIYAQDSE
jgi:hypothetical protein